MAAGPVGGSGGAMAAFVMNLLTDLAFNLLIFFVVCASIVPEKGRPQQMPSSSKDKQTDQKALNVEVDIGRDDVSVNKEKVPIGELKAKLQGLLANKTK